MLVIQPSGVWAVCGPHVLATRGVRVIPCSPTSPPTAATTVFPTYTGGGAVRIYINDKRDRVVIHGENPVLRGQRGTPGWYEIQLTWTQALGMAATLERMAKMIEPTLGNGPRPTVQPPVSEPTAQVYDDD